MTDPEQHDTGGEPVFTYRTTRDGKVFIFWQGKQIMILKGDGAGKLLGRLAGADSQQEQLVLAKITGHFKHGNERRDT
jgi:hypothetical protein